MQAAISRARKGGWGEWSPPGLVLRTSALLLLCLTLALLVAGCGGKSKQATSAEPTLADIAPGNTALAMEVLQPLLQPAERAVLRELSYGWLNLPGPDGLAFLPTEARLALESLLVDLFSRKALIGAAEAAGWYALSVAEVGRSEAILKQLERTATALGGSFLTEPFDLGTQWSAKRIVFTGTSSVELFLAQVGPFEVWAETWTAVEEVARLYTQFKEAKVAVTGGTKLAALSGSDLYQVVRKSLPAGGAVQFHLGIGTIRQTSEQFLAFMVDPKDATQPGRPSKPLLRLLHELLPFTVVGGSVSFENNRVLTTTQFHWAEEEVARPLRAFLSTSGVPLGMAGKIPPSTVGLGYYRWGQTQPMLDALERGCRDTLTELKAMPPAPKLESLRTALQRYQEVSPVFRETAQMLGQEWGYTVSPTENESGTGGQHVVAFLGVNPENEGVARYRALMEKSFADLTKGMLIPLFQLVKTTEPGIEYWGVQSALGFPGKSMINAGFERDRWWLADDRAEIQKMLAQGKSGSYSLEKHPLFVKLNVPLHEKLFAISFVDQQVISGTAQTMRGLQSYSSMLDLVGGVLSGGAVPGGAEVDLEALRMVLDNAGYAASILEVMSSVSYSGSAGWVDDKALHVRTVLELPPSVLPDARK